MEKVLVMGGSYFIGKKIVDIMKLAGYEVFTLNRGTQPSADGTYNIICDRNNKEKMIDALKDYQFSIVIDVSGINKIQAEIFFTSINKSSIKKFIFISSSAVYDIENLNTPYKETDRISENKYWTFYGKDKIDAEEYYSSCFSNTNTDLIILRPPYAYGENNYVQRESFIFNHLYNQEPIILPISNPKLQFIYTTDLANIILFLLDTELPKVSIFNVGNEEAVTSKQWVEICAEVMHKQANIIMYDYLSAGRNVRDFFPMQDYDNVLDVSRIKKFYEIETSFTVGLQNSYNWFIENRNNIDFKAEVAQNELAILKSLKYE